MKTSIASVFLALAGLNFLAAICSPVPDQAGAEGQVITGPPAARL
jgi:hypothetical protein